MKYQDMFNVVKELTFDNKVTVCNDDQGVEISIFRPAKLGKRFQSYDPKKNFQIWLKEGEREFRPNHLRVFIDLNLRSRSRPDLKRPLLTIFDNIFYGNDPDKEITLVKGETFEHYLNSLKIIANLAQLLIIEQNYGYHRESKFEPPTLFFQGWIRQFIDSPKEIDNLCMSVCKGQPPQARYTAKENRKGKKFEKSLSPLWYMNSE
jgi:hypothetical protein